MHTVLTCGEAQFALDIEWEDPRPGEESRVAQCRLQFRVGGWPFDLSFETDTRYLGWFLQEARQMHGDLEGRATLWSWDQECKIQMQVVDRGRGSIAVGIDVFRWLAWPSREPTSDEFPFGHEVRITVGGLFTDQSYLPAFLSDLTHFLAEADEGLG